MLSNTNFYTPTAILNSACPRNNKLLKIKVKEKQTLVVRNVINVPKEKISKNNVIDTYIPAPGSKASH